LQRKRVEKLNGNETFAEKKESLFFTLGSFFFFPRTEKKNRVTFLKKIRVRYTIAP